MSTDELELLLASSLHEDDSQSVDVHNARAVLRDRLERGQRAGRRRALIGIAAAVLAVVVTASLLLTGLRHEEATPVRPSPPRVAVSPSGLPVGLLKGTYEQDGLAGAILLLVRADGSGQLSSGVKGWQPCTEFGGAFGVEIRRAGPGRVSIAYDNPVLEDREVVTMSFIVRDRSVTIVSLGTPGNGLLAKASADAITGTVLHVTQAPELCSL
ncbi:MAG: hypothetical protein QOD68_2018 [Actinomycetota bacterium]|nr:hypothetical protein [Actinomycetota bacterium]